MRADIIFERLWNDYTKLNPEVGAIYESFIETGEIVINDHIAFRTVNHPVITSYSIHYTKLSELMFTECFIIHKQVNNRLFNINCINPVNILFSRKGPFRPRLLRKAESNIIA